MTKFTPQRKNANKHTEHGQRLLEKSLQQDGWIGAQTAAADGEMIAGSLRLEVAADKFADAEPIIVESDGKRPVIVVRTDIPNADDPRAKRLSVADNQIAHTDWSPDGELLAEWGKEDEAIRKMFADSEWKEITGEEKPTRDAPAVDEDKAEQMREKWQTESGQLWTIGNHRLLIGDCTNFDDIARLMDGGKAELCFTSPPYPGAEMWEQEGEKLVQVGNDCLVSLLDVLIPSGYLVWNTSDVPCSNDGYIPNIARDTIKALEIGFKKRGEIIWHKTMSYLPPPPFTRRPTIPNNTHESVLVFVLGDWKPRDKEGVLTAEQMEWNRDTIWKISTESAKAAGHKAPFPLELAARCVTLWSRENETVYDPFCGTGTTLAACEILGRIGRGMEIEPKYAALTLERFSQAFPELEIKRIG